MGPRPRLGGARELQGRAGPGCCRAPVGVAPSALLGVCLLFPTYLTSGDLFAEARSAKVEAASPTSARGASPMPAQATPAGAGIRGRLDIRRLARPAERRPDDETDTDRTTDQTHTLRALFVSVGDVKR